MKIFRKEKIEELVRKLVNDFLISETNRQSLITITRTKLNDKGDHVVAFYTVYPEDKESAVAHFIERNTKELQEFMRKKAPAFRVPFIKFYIDEGEKNRQNIDKLLREASVHPESQSL